MAQGYVINLNAKLHLIGDELGISWKLLKKDNNNIERDSDYKIMFHSCLYLLDELSEYSFRLNDYFISLIYGVISKTVATNERSITRIGKNDKINTGKASLLDIIHLNPILVKQIHYLRDEYHINKSGRIRIMQNALFHYLRYKDYGDINQIFKEFDNEFKKNNYQLPLGCTYTKFNTFAAKNSLEKLTRKFPRI